MSKCNLPPDGWKCSREAGHDGPCAATQSGSYLIDLLSELPKFHPAKEEYADLCLRLGEKDSRLAELEGIAERLSSDLRAVQEEQRGDVFAASIRDFAAYKEGKK